MSLALVLPAPARADELRRELSAGVTLFYIGLRLGHTGRSEKWLRTRIEWLTQQANFPAPLPSPKPKERRYSRRAVDQWFDDRLPPGALSSGGNPGAMAALLDARAANLHLIGGAA